MNKNIAQLLAFAALLLVVVSLVLTVLGGDLSSGFGVRIYTNICEQRVGSNWTYVNESISNENKTLACRAPNGTVKRVSAVVNSTA